MVTRGARVGVRGSQTGRGRVGKTWDWSRFADQFTEDATYVEHSFGTFHGREAIRDWIVAQMSVFPGSEMPFYPTTWHSIDTDRGWVLCEFRNRMREVAYNPMNFLPMVQGYLARCKSLGTLSDAGERFARTMKWELG